MDLSQIEKFFGVDSFEPSDICRVPVQLRKLKDEAYKAQEVSIAPHQEVPSLGSQYKLHYLKSLTEKDRQSGDEKAEQFNKKYYGILDEFLRIKKYEDKDVMSLVLGCFFVFEFIRRYADKEFKGDNEPIFATPLKPPTILRDILLFEAQFPFSILQRLYDLTTEESQVKKKAALKTMVAELFNDLLPNLGHIPPQDRAYLNHTEEVHLLGLVHRNLRPPPAPATPPAEVDDIPMQIIPVRENFDLTSILSATELRQFCAVKFKKVSAKDAGSLFNITFDSKKGILKIPTIFVEDVTEALLRNMMVYEYMDRKAGVSYVTHYMLLMKCLIRSPEDVKLLCDCKIIRGMANNYGAIAEFFLGFGVNGIDSCHDFFYQSTMEQLRNYSARKRNRVKATVCGWIETLRQTYFRNPWTFISLLGAILLLVLTLLQTIYTILSYYNA